jgi:hypothetical protein
MEFLFDMERAVEAVEKRVPFGHSLMRCLLSAGVLYAILLLIHSLWFEFIWPFAKFASATGAIVVADLRNGNPFPYRCLTGSQLCELVWRYSSQEF